MGIQLDDADFQRAYRYAIALCGDRDGAYDLVHSAVVNWLQASPRDLRQPLAYFLRIVRNCFIADSRRAAQLRWAPLEDAEGAIATDLLGMEQLMIHRDLLDRTWSTLGASEREVLYLWAVEGFTVEEISQQTGTPRGTLLTRMHRLRQRFATEGQPRTRGETS